MSTVDRRDIALHSISLRFIERLWLGQRWEPVQERAILTKLRNPRGTNCGEPRHVNGVVSLRRGEECEVRRSEQLKNLIGEELVVHNVFR